MVINKELLQKLKELQEDEDNLILLFGRKPDDLKAEWVKEILSQINVKRIGGISITEYISVENNHIDILTFKVTVKQEPLYYEYEGEIVNLII